MNLVRSALMTSFLGRGGAGIKVRITIGRKAATTSICFMKMYACVARNALYAHVQLPWSRIHDQCFIAGYHTWPTFQKICFCIYNMHASLLKYKRDETACFHCQLVGFHDQWSTKCIWVSNLVIVNINEVKYSPLSFYQFSLDISINLTYILHASSNFTRFINQPGEGRDCQDNTSTYD